MTGIADADLASAYKVNSPDTPNVDYEIHENFICNVNENLGRELLELFSLGEFNYDEVDVKNMAKALTGHSINSVTLEYKFINGAATSKDWVILGSKKGSLEDVVDLLINHAKLSELLSKKFYREYISLDLPSKNNLDYLIYELYSNDFEISSLLRATLELPEFWDKKNRLDLVKSPIDPESYTHVTVRTICSV